MLRCHFVNRTKNILNEEQVVIQSEYIIQSRDFTKKNVCVKAISKNACAVRRNIAKAGLFYGTYTALVVAKAPF